jgi:hypothetical protein
MKDIRREVLAGVKVGRTVATPVAPQPLFAQTPARSEEARVDSSLVSMQASS